MHTILMKLASIIIAPIVLIGGLFSPNVPVSNTTIDTNPPSVGATLPQATGVFETSLATPITSTATSMTLTSNVIRGGGAVSGYSCFTVDEGSAQAEVICGTVSSTTVSSLTRGISYSDGVTSVSGNKFAHRRGANVKITDFPIIQILKAQNNGDATFANPLKYESGIAPLAADDLTDKEYVDGVAIAGAPDASTTVKGIGKTSVAPVSSTNPIFVGDNDGRVPTQSENDALVGTSGTPSTSNKYVTNDDTTGTGSVVRDSVVSGIVASISKFGGTGADGALNVTSGTTTIDLANANVVVKNYTSINISNGATLAFSNPATTGTVIILKSTGAVTIAGTVDIRSMGGAGGLGGTYSTGYEVGITGSIGTGLLFNSVAGIASALTPTGSGQQSNGATAVQGIGYNSNTIYSKVVSLTPGAGGSGGTAGNAIGSNGGAGGRGAGSMYIESLGALSITGTIQATGTAGTNGTSGSGASGGAGGGGGAGGQFIVLYNSTITNSGTYNITGGAGGNGANATASSGGNGSAGGGGGGNYYAGGGGGRIFTNNGNNGNVGASGSGPSPGTGGTGGTASTASGGSGGGGGASGYSIVVANTELN